MNTIAILRCKVCFREVNISWQLPLKSVTTLAIYPSVYGGYGMGKIEVKTGNDMT